MNNHNLCECCKENGADHIINFMSMDGKEIRRVLVCENCEQKWLTEFSLAEWKKDGKRPG